MKTLIISLFILANLYNTISLIASNDIPNRLTPDKRSDAIANKLKEVCKLTPEQRTYVWDVIYKREKQKDLDREKFHKNLTAATNAKNKRNQTANEELKTIMDTTQFKAYEKWLKEIKKKRETAKTETPSKEDPDLIFIQMDDE
ncbi:MAG: hypothetical protein A2275_07500 [Bacteroidetes bacterium RIFOXYA12_FULL_35_11]|nr:MAG: hypothetical protein A2X01_04260 [Bacteroidetes bacterium GWF2_35_48]OFY73134.1 MAG: hypothetical protein A2275_07500 [Bacteroidetes bacterium RIFOXYA12_FULL_35_11]OFY95838.1 MAG: hypothetical protein A2491_14870 [Bacteroidetes bacterium RIFOXYC12_FULL_35_7]HBX51564.1 hypothetical protein [Bacteroidales bacterium]